MDETLGLSLDIAGTVESFVALHKICSRGKLGRGRWKVRIEFIGVSCSTSNAGMLCFSMFGLWSSRIFDFEICRSTATCKSLHESSLVVVWVINRKRGGRVVVEYRMERRTRKVASLLTVCGRNIMYCMFQCS